MANVLTDYVKTCRRCREEFLCPFPARNRQFCDACKREKVKTRSRTHYYREVHGTFEKGTSPSAQRNNNPRTEVGLPSYAPPWMESWIKFEPSKLRRISIPKSTAPDIFFTVERRLATSRAGILSMARFLYREFGITWDETQALIGRKHGGT
jgi:hypothetical protein